MKKYIEKCPICGGRVVEKDVTESLAGGVNFVKARVGGCQHCGERLYSPEVVKKFEEIENKLQQQDTSGFKLLGNSFEVTSFE